MVSPNGDKSGADRRYHRRFEVFATGEMEPLNHNDVGGQPVGVTIRDVGLTGMLLKLDRPVRPGSTWRLWLIDGDKLVTSVPVVVRHVGMEGDEHRAGVQVMMDPFLLTFLGVPAQLAEDELGKEERFVRRP